MKTLLIVLGFAGVLLSGCTMTGTIQGMWKPRLEAKSKPVTLNYVQFPSGTSGTLELTLPTGEVYTGKFVQITSATSSNNFNWGGWQPYWGDWAPFGGPWYEGPAYSTFQRNYSGKVLATLLGDKNGTLRCRFQLAEPSYGLPGGGIGECEGSQGQRIKVTF
jgi:hypothetical protein